MNEFKVGDIVTGKPESDKEYAKTNSEMLKGLVVSVVGENIDVKILKHKETFCVGSKYTVSAEFFKKIGELKPFNKSDVLALIAKGKVEQITEYNLSDADLSGADLSDANLSGANGLLNAINYMEAHFERTKEGYIVYKTFGSQWSPNPKWEIKRGHVIEETVNHTRTQECGCGINVAPLEWVKKNYPGDIYKLLIKFEWLSEVCVPYNTDGKIRCGRAKIIGKVARTDD